MARSQNEARGGALPDGELDAATADLAARMSALELAVEALATEGIKAKLESPELLAELMAAHGLDRLATRVAELESVFNRFEGTDKPDLMMRLQDMEARIEDLDRRAEETVQTVARGLSELRAVMTDLSAQLALELDAGAEG